MTKQGNNPRPELGGGGWSRDWRMWTVVVLMLAAMVVYILSLDNESAPGEPGNPAPAGVEAQ